MSRAAVPKFPSTAFRMTGRPRDRPKLLHWARTSRFLPRAFPPVRRMLPSGCLRRVSSSGPESIRSAHASRPPLWAAAAAQRRNSWREETRRCRRQGQGRTAPTCRAPHRVSPAALTARSDRAAYMWICRLLAPARLLQGYGRAPRSPGRGRFSKPVDQVLAARSVIQLALNQITVMAQHVDHVHGDHNVVKRRLTGRRCAGLQRATSSGGLRVGVAGHEMRQA